MLSDQRSRTFNLTSYAIESKSLCVRIKLEYHKAAGLKKEENQDHCKLIKKNSSLTAHGLDVCELAAERQYFVKKGVVSIKFHQEQTTGMNLHPLIVSISNLTQFAWARGFAL